MKAIRHISIVLMILAAGTAGIQAQRTNESETRSANSRTAVKQNTPRSTQVRSTSKKSAQRQSVQRKAVQRPTVKKSNVERSTFKKPVSISTRNNPRSDYRAIKTYRTARNMNYKEKRYYSGKHYHHVYPGTHMEVNVHHHYDTYHHHYRVLYRPVYREIYWTRNMHRYYNRWYPDYYWRYNYGYRIRTISIFEAKYNLGEVTNVYGRVYGTWYNRETDDYLLFFGGDYPYQQFSVVVPGKIARRYNWRPERYFLGEHVTVTGLVTTYNGIPEIIVKDRRQLELY